ncbi:wsaB [Geobacillus kaustophilus GBlys]|uniref:WsaB n=1 Tax=Geobacillus kaustophilus GBlys TaxID=1337888 RepID=U2Y9N6_GEOKU|nr:O-antigen ligase family protein [Geobacillus kaustophilus]GAD13503.1 wsaB [Geobacillus kaustophilus GBlys]
MSDWYKYLQIERDAQEDRLDRERVDTVLFWGLASIIVIVPLIVRLHIADFIGPTITQTTVLDTGPKADVFTYYKSMFLLCMTVLLTLLFLYKVFVLHETIPKTNIYIGLAVLAVCLTLSAVFAPYKTLALYGMHDRHEGTLTYLCYVMLCFIAANIRCTMNRIRWFVYSLYPFVLINAALGVVNFFGYDVLKVSWIQRLLYSSLPEGAKIAEGSRFLATINHGNYVSGISACLIVLFSTLAILEGRLWQKFTHGFFASLSFALLLSSLSSNGFVTIVLMSPVLVYIMMRTRQKKQALLSIASLLFAFSAIYIPFVKHDSRVWDETIGFFVGRNPFQLHHEQAAAWQGAAKNLKQMATDIAETMVSGSSAYAAEPEYKLPELPGPGIAPGSGRAFIWKKAIELIGQKPFFGYGLDTFPYFFNQDDPEKNANLGEGYSVIVDKPHNMYIGLAFGAGLLALIAFLVIIGSWLIDITRSVRMHLHVYPFALSLGLIAYLIQGLFNDSIVGTAVFFWIGLGLSVSFIMHQNQTIKKEQGYERIS